VKHERERVVEIIRGHLINRSVGEVDENGLISEILEEVPDDSPEN